MSRFRTAASLVAAAAAAALLGPAPAGAAAVGPLPDPPPAGRYGVPARGPGAQLTLSHLADAGHAAAVKLTCEPPGGGHPRAAAACATLERIDADPGRLTPAPTMCIMLYAPVTAEITGRWRGMTMKWTHRYGNSCEMRRATGVLFDF